MKLAELITLFTRFGFTEQYVRTRLGAGSSAFNAFEGLKSELQVAWADLNIERSPTVVAALRSDYDRIMGMTMKSRVTAADQRKRDKPRKGIPGILNDACKQRSENRFNTFFDTLLGKK